MNELSWVGNILRAVLSLAVLFFTVGLASRVCTRPGAWLGTAAFFGVVFGYLALGVVPQPTEAGLLYAIEWGIGGTAAYCLAQGFGWIGPSRFQRRRAEEEK